LGDLAVSEKAKAAAEELRISLEKAKAVNDGLIDKYAAGGRSGDKGPGGGGGGGGSAAEVFVDVDAAEDEVFAEMEAWRKQRKTPT
jgi:hypothetical protein